MDHIDCILCVARVAVCPAACTEPIHEPNVRHMAASDDVNASTADHMQGFFGMYFHCCMGRACTRVHDVQTHVLILSGGCPSAEILLKSRG